jgi:hypothetical protein
MPTFEVTCIGRLPWSAVTELGRRGVLRRTQQPGDRAKPGDRHVLRIEGAQGPDAAALIALRQLREVGGRCEKLEVAGVAG